MNAFLVLLAIFSASFLAPASHAATDQQILNNFRQSARVLPQKMIASGYRQIGDLNADQFLRNLSKVQTRVVSNLDNTRSADSSTNLRNSGHWRRGPDGSEVAVHGPRWNKTPNNHRPTLAFHENLGALGFRDGNFSCSSSIWLLTNANARTTLNREEIASIERIAESECRFAGGGSTGVTGGGDDHNVGFKISVIEKGLKAVRSAKNREEREAAMGEIQSVFYRSFEMVNGFKPKKQKYSLNEVIYLRAPADVRTLKVWVNGKPVKKDPKNGWSYDAKKDPLRVYLHGRAVPKEMNHSVVDFDRLR